MTTERKWSCIWLLWGTYFCVAEYVAVRTNDHHAPLSHHLRRALGIRKKPWQQRAGQVALGAGTVWFVTHLYEEAASEQAPV